MAVTHQQKYAVIDRDEMQFVAIAKDRECAGAIADCASMDSTIVVFPLDVKRNFSTFSVLELMLLHKNTSGIPSVPGAIMDYAQAIGKCFDLATSMPVDSRTIMQLNAEVAKLPEPVPLKTMPKLPPVLLKLSEAQNYAPTTTTVVPKAPRAPSAPGAAPSKGATGKVWAVADRVHAENGGGPITKELRTKIIAACEAEGINGGTAATQYGKWKATKS